MPVTVPVTLDTIEEKQRTTTIDGDVLRGYCSAVPGGARHTVSGRSLFSGHVMGVTGVTGTP
jgi:hypothetical protein